MLPFSSLTNTPQPLPGQPPTVPGRVWVVRGLLGLCAVLVVGGLVLLVWRWQGAETPTATPSPAAPTAQLPADDQATVGDSVSPTAPTESAVSTNAAEGSITSSPSATQPASQPSTVDSDGDGLGDVFETTFGLNPKNKDSDGDGFTDFEEVMNGYNPLGPGKWTAPTIHLPAP